MNKCYRVALFCAAFLTVILSSCLSGKNLEGDINITETADKNVKPTDLKKSVSFIALGDLHWCDESYYDLDAMLADKPGDHRQITATYSPVTEANWKDLLETIKDKVKTTSPDVGCVVQLGDLSEGLANTPGGAYKIAESVINEVKNAKISVPFLLTKGNHDVTGVGDEYKKEAREAYTKFYTPFIKEQTGNSGISNATYTYTMGNVLFVMLDTYDKSIDQLAFLKDALENSDAKHKFVCMHDPIIPASERCWHYMRQNEPKRQEFIKVLAENKAILLCAHLHRYSVLRRNTEWGPIVQVMITSATDKKRKTVPGYEKSLDDYGAPLLEWKPNYNTPERMDMLTAEARYVDYYTMCNLAGYAVISISGKKGEVELEYYPMWSDQPYDTVNLTKLLNGK